MHPLCLLPRCPNRSILPLSALSVEDNNPASSVDDATWKIRADLSPHPEKYRSDAVTIKGLFGLLFGRRGIPGPGSNQTIECQIAVQKAVQAAAQKAAQRADPTTEKAKVAGARVATPNGVQVVDQAATHGDEEKEVIGRRASAENVSRLSRDRCRSTPASLN